MNIHIEGQTLEQFRVTVDDGTRTEVFNIAELLVVDENDITAGVICIAAREHFWHQVALDAELEYEKFKQTTIAAFNAHHDKYARWYLKAIGEKTFTNTAKDNIVVNMFSHDGHELQEEYLTPTYIGYEMECNKVGLTPKPKEKFMEEMYCYEPHYEDAVESLLALEHKSRQLKCIADAFGNLAWNLKSLAATQRTINKNDIF